MWAELEGIICSGPRRGKQFTYALLDERAPNARVLSREDALTELARRYFERRGPATVHDFAKWSGLTVSDCRKGLEEIRPLLQQEQVGEQTFWFSKTDSPPRQYETSAYLLSVYDEYVSSYKDQSTIISAENAERLTAMGNALNYIIVVDGQIAGTWRRTLKKREVIIETNQYIGFTETQNQALMQAAWRYGAFLNLEVVLQN
jgi:hypothetical protein